MRSGPVQYLFSGDVVSLCSELHLYILEERDQSPLLYNEIPRNIRKRFLDALDEIKKKTRTASDPDQFERLQMEADSLKSSWAELIQIRRDKILDKAIIEIDGEKKPDLSGILPWEEEHYSKIVEALSLLAKSYGAVQ